MTCRVWVFMCAVYITVVLFTLHSQSVAVTVDDSAGVNESLSTTSLLTDCDISAIAERHLSNHMFAFDVHRPSSRSDSRAKVRGESHTTESSSHTAQPHSTKLRHTSPASI
jgi:hypothetical protein